MFIVILVGGSNLKARMSKNATMLEKPMWIMVSVMGYGKLKYFADKTHCNSKPKVHMK